MIIIIVLVAYTPLLYMLYNVCPSLNNIGLSFFFLSCQFPHAVVPRDSLGTGRRHHVRCVPLVTTSDYRVLGKEKIKLKTQTLKNNRAVAPAVTEVLVAVSVSVSVSVSLTLSLFTSLSLSLSLSLSVI